jgi:hypothetical protein
VREKKATQRPQHIFNPMSSHQFRRRRHHHHCRRRCGGGCTLRHYGVTGKIKDRQLLRQFLGNVWMFLCTGAAMIVVCGCFHCPLSLAFVPIRQKPNRHDPIIMARSRTIIIIINSNYPESSGTAKITPPTTRSSSITISMTRSSCRGTAAAAAATTTTSGRRLSLSSLAMQLATTKDDETDADYDRDDDEEDKDVDDGWGTSEEISSLSSSSPSLAEKVALLRTLQQGINDDNNSSSKNQQVTSSQQNRNVEQERDLFIPIFALVSLAGLFGAYGYEMLRLASRGELYLPWNNNN